MIEDNDKKFDIDFIGIGAPKCATTWIYRCLCEHPQICGTYKKELSFFITKKTPFEKDDKNFRFFYKEGMGSYASYFSGCKEKQVKGEFSVYYLSDPGAAKLIKKHFPDVKLLACLRDPVKRAHSLYWYAKMFRLKEKSKTFEEAIERNKKAYIDVGMYYKNLVPYFDLFPRENIGVFFVDDLKKDPIIFMQSIYRFLGVDDSFVAPSVNKKENVARGVKNKLLKRVLNFIGSRTLKLLDRFGLYSFVGLLKKIGLEKLFFLANRKLSGKPISRPKIRKETESKLRSVFKEDIENLEKLLNKDLSCWK